MAGYQPNTWEVYDESIPDYKQPDAFITKLKLDNIEKGIINAVTDFQIGTVSKGTEVYCEIIADEDDPSIKKINMVIPKEVSWLFSEAELQDQNIAPSGVMPNDIILDSKGNIFTITKNSNDVYILNKRINIKGTTGDIGPQGLPGKDGKDGEEYYLEIGNVVAGDYASAEINDHKLNLVLPRGLAGKSTYDLWKELGYPGDANDFLFFLRGDSNTIDSLDSTSTTDALSANQGRILKNNRLTTLDDILANEKEGIFVDALAVKEMYLKLQELVESKLNNAGGE